MKKGSYGYLRRKRIVSLLKSALFLSAVFVIYFAALRHFGTNKNVFSILAAVLALPAGRSIVVSILCVRARSASAQVWDAVSGVRGLSEDTSGYDLYLTAYETAFSLSHAACGRKRVIGYTEDPGTNTGQCAQHIAMMLAKDDNPGYKVSIYTDLGTYIRELEAVTAPVSPDTGDQEGSEGSVDPEEAGTDPREKDRRAMKTLYAVSL